MKTYNPKRKNVIYVFDNDINSALRSLKHETQQMMKELKYEFDKHFDDWAWNEITSENEFYESQDFEFGPMEAWSNIDCDCLCDWKIVEIK